MQELEKILKEIKSALKEIYLDIANNYDISDLSFDDSKVACVASKFRCAANDKVEKIIHIHMFSKDTDITNKCGDCSRRKWYQKGYEDGKKNGGWISVEERLPGEKGIYLVTYHPCYWDDVGTELCVGIDTFRGKTAWAQRKYQRVIAWQPLPEPYHPEEL